MNYPKKPSDNEWQQKYNAYIKSAQWKNIRKLLFSQRGEKCELCGHGSDRLEIHHLTYERLTKELPKDLQVVCHGCHGKADIKRASVQSYVREFKRMESAFSTWCEKRGVEEDNEDEYEKFTNWLESKNDY